MVFGDVEVEAELVVGGGRMMIVLRRTYVVIEGGAGRRRRRLLVMAEVYGLEAVSEVYEVSEVSGV